MPTHDKLRAIVEEAEKGIEFHAFEQFRAEARQTIVLAQALLAVLGMCKDHAPNIGCMSYVTPIDPIKLRDLIDTKLKEMP